MCGTGNIRAFFKVLFKLFAPHKRAKMDHAVSTQKKRGLVVVVLNTLNVIINKYEQRASATSYLGRVLFSVV